MQQSDRAQVTCVASCDGNALACGWIRGAHALRRASGRSQAGGSSWLARTDSFRVSEVT